MGLFGKKKREAKITGDYFGGHPDIRGSKHLKLTATESGVVISEKKNAIFTLPWEYITGFSYDVVDNTRSGSRVSATRVAAFGVIGLAARKEKTSVNVKMVSVLSTTGGDIQIENDVRDSGAFSTASSMAQSYATILEKQQKAFRIYVADHMNS